MRPSIAQAVRQLILSNELAGTRSGLRQLIAWLGEIADDFAIDGCDVDDLRWEIRRLERELRRRTGALIIALTFLTSGLLDGCSSPASIAPPPFAITVKVGTVPGNADTTSCDVVWSAEPNDDTVHVTYAAGPSGGSYVEQGTFTWLKVVSWTQGTTGAQHRAGAQWDLHTPRWVDTRSGVDMPCGGFYQNP